MKNNSTGVHANSSTFTVHDRLAAAITPTSSSTNCSIQLSNNCQATIHNNGHVLSVGNLPTNNSTTNINQHADLVNLFECPVCFDYALPPILQCQSGHIVCAQCRLKLSSCPTCRGPLVNIRNLAMEKVADTIVFPCKYQNGGCHSSLNHKDKLLHEESCDFRPVTIKTKGTHSF